MFVLYAERSVFGRRWEGVAYLLVVGDYVVSLGVYVYFLFRRRTSVVSIGKVASWYRGFHPCSQLFHYCVRVQAGFVGGLCYHFLVRVVRSERHGHVDNRLDSEDELWYFDGVNRRRYRLLFIFCFLRQRVRLLRAHPYDVHRVAGVGQ